MHLKFLNKSTHSPGYTSSKSMKQINQNYILYDGYATWLLKLKLAPKITSEYRVNAKCIFKISK